jgi:hypothetical protein
MRPHLEDPERLRGIVRVTNAGTRDTSRHLEVRSADAVIVAESLALAPGEVAQREFNVPASSATLVHATITPGDAVPEDDELTLQRPDAQRVRVRLDAHCGAHLSQALRSHPSLLVAGEGAPDLEVWCADGPPRTSVPVLWFRRPAKAPEDAQPLSPTANGYPLVSEREGPHRTLEVRGDMESRGWVRRPEYPAFLAELLDRIVGRPLLDPVARHEVPEGAARIAPREPGIGAAVTPRAAGVAPADLAGFAVVFAALLLLLDIWRTRSGR